MGGKHSALNLRYCEKYRCPQSANMDGKINEFENNTLTNVLLKKKASVSSFAANGNRKRHICTHMTDYFAAAAASTTF